MNSVNKCQQCGGVLPQVNALGGRCPRCMLALGFETESRVAEDSNGSLTERVDKDPRVAARPVAIGRYRILRVVGEGGMGVVYEAEQDQPRRTVALKIIKPALASPELLRRFELESHALGRLQHPGIAQIYEAGTVDTGFGPQPYFAMELIRGLSPRDYAETHHLNTRDRLAMTVKICDAVHHAHQRGLIHRDLKPGNILVDATGQPKILDFGVARVTDSDARATLQTDMGQLVGTLAYMSPEQALADPMDIDTRSDVYALGVILYELLTGRLPYTISKKLHETIQAIREADPDPLSTVNRAYRGDIETIVRKALEKDRTRRYASAAGMAADIQRYLNDEPIAARPPSASYQLRKFARRNKALVAGVAAVFIALVVGVGAFAWMANLYLAESDRAVEGETRAAEEAERASVLAYFFGASLFGMADPYAQGNSNESTQTRITPDPNISLKGALDLAVRRIPDQFARQPLMEALVREYVADTYTGMGRYIEAQDQLEVAVALRRRLQGETTPETIQAAVKLADAYSNSKMYSKAEEQAKKVIVAARSSSGNVDSHVKKAVSILVFIYSGSFANADQYRGFPEIERFLRREVIDYQREKSGAAGSTVQFAVEELLSLYTDSKPTPKYSEAESFMEQIANDRRRSLGEDDPATLKAEKQLIALYLISQPQPKYAEAEAYLTRLVEDLRRGLGDEHDATRSAVNYLVSVSLSQPRSRYAEVEALLESVIEKARVRLAPELGNESGAMSNASIGLARIYFKTGRDTEAVNLLAPLVSAEAVKRAIAHFVIVDVQPPILDSLDRSQIYGRRANGALSNSMARLTILERPTILDALDVLGQIYRKQGNSALADQMANNLTAILKATLTSAGNTDPLTNNSAAALKNMSAFAIRYIEQDRFVDADDLVNEVVRGYRQFAASGVNVRGATPLTSAARTTNNSGNDSSVSGYQHLAGSSQHTQDIATLLASAATSYSSKGMDLEAEKTLKMVRDINHSVLGDSTWDTQRSVWRLASWYMDRSRYEEAQYTYDLLSKIQSESYGSTHTITRTTMVDIMGVYWDRFQIESAGGRRDHLRLLLERNLELRKRLLALYRLEPDGETSGNARMMISGSGSILGMLGRYPEAADSFKNLIDIQETAVDVQQESIPAAIANLGWTQFHQRKFSEAGNTLREALRGYENLNSQTWERYNTESMLGAVLVAVREYEEAEQHLKNSYQKLLLLHPRPGPLSGFTAEAEPGERIISLYQSWGKPGELSEWRKRLMENKTTASTDSSSRSIKVERRRTLALSQ